MVPIFLNFCRVCIESRKVRNIIAAEILLKFVIAWNPGHRWEIKPKEIKRRFANQQRGRNFRSPGPVK